jgi:hypothetical protein
MLIGVPVAATPGLVPQEEVETVLALAVLDADDAGAEAAAVLLELVLVVGAVVVELLEELQPATTPSASAATTAAAARVRQWKGLFMCSAFSWLTASFPSERARGFAYQAKLCVQGASRRNCRSPVHKQTVLLCTAFATSRWVLFWIMVPCRSTQDSQRRTVSSRLPRYDEPPSRS